ASSVWAPGCDSLWFHSRVPTAHEREALHFVNGPVVFWDLSCVQEDYGEGGRTTSASDRLGNRSGGGSGYLSNSGIRSPKHAREALSFVNGPIVFWDLLSFPEDYGEGGQLPLPIA
ncbi:unnamed protein product, partial [Staurois parvus]